jgi:hypothetical protein
MERFFAPCDRFNEAYLQHYGGRRHFRAVRNTAVYTREEERVLIVDIEDVLAAGYTFSDWSVFAKQGNRELWISEWAFISGNYVSGEQIGFTSVKFEAYDSAGEIMRLYACAAKDEVLASNLILDLLIACKTLGSVELTSISSYDLTKLLEPTHLCLAKIILNGCILDDDDCRILAAASRPGLAIELNNCDIMEGGARLFAKSLRLNQGPTKVSRCIIDGKILAEAFRGNTIVSHCIIDGEILAEAFRGNTIVTALTVFGFHFADNTRYNHELNLLARFLRDDRGLVKLNLVEGMIDAETLGALCLSLQTHPVLEELCFPIISTGSRISMQDHWMSRVMKMLQVNTSVQDVQFCGPLDPVGREIYRKSVRPLLNQNIIRKRLRAIQKAPMALREKLLGLFLQRYSMDPVLMWMLVSENPSNVLLVLRNSAADERWEKPKERDESATARWQKLRDTLNPRALTPLATVIVIVGIVAIVSTMPQGDFCRLSLWLPSFSPTRRIRK